MDKHLMHALSRETDTGSPLDQEVRRIRGAAVDQITELACTLTRYWLAVDEQYDEIPADMLPRTLPRWDELHAARAERIMLPLVQMLDAEACAVISIVPDALTDRNDGTTTSSLGITGRSPFYDQFGLLKTIRGAADSYTKTIILERIKEGDFALVDMDSLQQILGQHEPVPTAKGDA